MNYEKRRISCICNLNLTNEIEKEFFEDKDNNFFSYILELINYKIIICYEKLFDINNYINNIGFYISIFMCISFIILFLLYLTIGEKKIKKQYFLRGPKEEEDEKKEKGKGKDNINTKKKSGKSHSNINNINKLTDFVKKDQIEEVNLNINKDLKILNKLNPEKKKKRKNKKKKYKKRKIVSIKENYKNSSGSIKLSRSEIYLKNHIINPKVLDIFNKSNNLDKTIDEKIDYSELTYLESLEKDKRNIFAMFKSVFILKFQTLQIIFFPKEFTHISITLSLYLFDIFLDITLNSLLFSDQIMSEKYHNEGSLFFITSNILSVSANIASFIIIYFIEKLINQYEVLKMVCAQIKNINNFLSLYIRLFRCFKIKIIIFYILIFLIGLLCTYYLFIFFAIYKKIQKDLFFNYFIGNLWSLGFTVFISLSIAITRKIALKIKYKRLFIISQFIEEKF